MMLSFGKEFKIEYIDKNGELREEVLYSEEGLEIALEKYKGRWTEIYERKVSEDGKLIWSEM
jgi:hypothetical protein